VKATEVTTGRAESNGSLLPGLWRDDSLHVTCGLTACTPGSAPGPTRMGKLYLFYTPPAPPGLRLTAPHDETRQEGARIPPIETAPRLY